MPQELQLITERRARVMPGRAACVTPDGVLDWAMLHERVLRAAGALRREGLGPGDRLGHLGLNHVDFLVLLMAAARVGAVLAPVNWRLAPAEIGEVARHAGMKAMFVDEGFRPALTEARVDAPVVAMEGFDAWLAGPDDTLFDAGPEHVLLQLYTSGTTGLPKGVLLPHRALMGTIGKGPLTGEAWARWSDDDVCLVAMPLYHIGGCGWALHGLHAGALSIVLPRPEIDAIAEAIDRHRVTRLFAVPAVLNMILNHPVARQADFSCVRALLYGASPIPLDVLKRSMNKFPNAHFVQCYGATETSGTVVYLPPADHHPEGTERMTGCGRPFPGNEVRIVDDDMRALPPRQVGEIAVRSVSVMAGYHDAPEATAKALVGDWYLTGDAGWMDEDGYLYIHDRVKDMIVSGAENIYPAEVENALHAHWAVADAAVIGVPDERWGEAVKAFVVLTEGGGANEAELIAHCRTRIAGFKCPKSVEFVDELPRNPSGKILKKELRRAHWPADGRQVA